VKSVRFLQIGDIHYPEAVQEIHGDLKDASFPAGLANLTRTNPLQAVVRRLVDQKVDGVLVSGDLTSKGDVSEYGKCVQYLVDNLSFTSADSDRLHAVPGNHDVERSKIDPSGKDLLSKFKACSVAWSSRSLPVLVVDSPRITDFPATKKCRVRVLSLNSSWGCGERYFPIPIKDSLEKMLKDYEDKVGSVDAFAILGEALDTPIISKDDLEIVCRDIRTADKSTIPLVLAHHNILPQALPRVSVYTELLNGGNIRSRFCHLNRPILYCHGHIHDRPVEIIHEPVHPGSKVICISAPELKRGFNVVEIVFSSRNVPIGCRIILYELDMRDGDVFSKEQLVPLQEPNSYRFIGSKGLLSLLGATPEEELRFSEVMDIAKRKRLKLTKSTMAEILGEGKWLGCFQITNQDQDPDYWYVKRLV
jgi:hypothetical protein